MIDPSLLKAYQLGIAIGVLIISTLILFPGRAEVSGAVSTTTTAKQRTVTGDDQTTVSEDDVSNMQRQRKPRTFSFGDSKTAPPPNAARDSYWTPHRRLNAAVYAILIGTMIVLTVQSYSDGYSDGKSKPTTYLKVLWNTYFPKEAAVLRGPPQTKRW